MKLALLGATGPTGLKFLEEALKAEHTVVAVVRNTDKIPETMREDDKLTVVQGDIFTVDDLAPQFEGADAVVSCLGYPGIMLPFTTMNFYLPSCQAIVEAMKKAKVRRFVTITSYGTKTEEGASFLLEWIVKPLFIGRHTADMGRMEDYLETEKDSIDYTSVRPPGLTYADAVDKEVKACIDRQFVPYAAMQMPRANVAKFMLDCINAPEYKGKCVAIGI